MFYPSDKRPGTEGMHDLVEQNQSAGKSLIEGALVQLEIRYPGNDRIRDMVRVLNQEVDQDRLQIDMPHPGQIREENKEMPYIFGYRRVGHNERRSIQPIDFMDAKIFLHYDGIAKLLSEPSKPEFHRLDETMQKHLWIALYYSYIDAIGRKAIREGDIQHFLTPNVTIASRPSDIIKSGARMLGIDEQEALSYLPKGLIDIGLEDVQEVFNDPHVQNLLAEPTFKKIRQTLELYLSKDPTNPQNPATATEGIGLFVFQRAMLRSRLSDYRPKLPPDYEGMAELDGMSDEKKRKLIDPILQDNDEIVFEVLRLALYNAKIGGLL